MAANQRGLQRDRIVEHLREHPGDRPSDVARVFDVHPSTAEYHLRRLVQTGRVARVDVGRELHHYPVGGRLCRRARAVHARLTPAARCLLEIGLERRVFPRQTLVGEGFSASAVRWAMDRMEGAGVLERLAWGVYELLAEHHACVRAALEEAPCAGCREPQAGTRQDVRRATSRPSPSGRIEASRSG